MLDRRGPVGGLLRQWRQRRRLSQLDLACDAGISTRHLSFVETGRAHPSRDMLLHLSEQLDVPVRERNVLLVAAGYAPIFPERPLTDPALTAARSAIDLVLARSPTPPSRSTGNGGSSRAMARCRNCTKGSPPISWNRRSMRCGCRCIRRGSRRASSISRNGARISFIACAARSS
jgi:transcriptional regulator with XRE-family HTH domain